MALVPEYFCFNRYWEEVNFYGPGVAEIDMYPLAVWFQICRSVWFRSCMSDKEGQMGWISAWQSRLLRVAWHSQRTQQSRNVGVGRKVCLYGSGSKGLMRVGWRDEGKIDLLLG